MRRVVMAVRKLAVRIFGGGVFQGEGPTSAKTLRWERAWCKNEEARMAEQSHPEGK